MFSFKEKILSFIKKTALFSFFSYNVVKVKYIKPTFFYLQSAYKIIFLYPSQSDKETRLKIKIQKHICKNIT